MRAIIACIVLLPLLVGCTTSPQSAESNQALSQPTFQNLWQEKCKKYKPLTNQEWSIAYDAIIKDVCQSTNISNEVTEVIYSPGVNQERLQKFLQTATFSFSYWRDRTANFKPVKIYLLTEKDEQWMRNELEPLLKDPGVIEWFGPDAKGVGRCWNIGPTAACGAKYPTWETVSGELVYVNVLGTQKVPDIEYNIDPAHNAVHWYQDSHGYQHWDDAFLEGQATLYEIAFHILYTGSDKKREDGAWLAHDQDGIKFTARTQEDVIQHMSACSKNENGPLCNYYFYFGGAMQQEKMILDFGYDKYLAWHESLREVRTPEGYEKAFSEVFGVELRTWQKTALAQYLADSFDYYISKWGD